ncbi:hypothetical protein [Aequorivita lipolytica]|uniref:Uncharacterized protein n=1 Tax=Aequorivita lipolytica TaxID=153267 RepID=A0A5C6YU80_9FLAO|nr:hypothetical protein [Aequorivita lipolytica]TXD70587.1 hypothetical protein ESV24_00400 [Aequorivita lipolytica]SRX49619.1 hypothetical protein AEQU2_00082 [Aequorivita lipolytica]
MKTFPFEILFKLSLDQQLQFLVENEIFNFDSELSISEIYELYDDQKLDTGHKSLFDIIEDDSFSSNKKYLEYLFNEFLKEIKHYETGEKLGQAEQWFKYKFKENTTFALNKKDALNAALKLKKKAIKKLKKNNTSFFPFHCFEMDKLKDYFHEFWFDEGSYLPRDESINKDVLSFAFSGLKHNDSFDYAQLKNFSDWIEVVSTLRSIKFLDDIILECERANSFDNYMSPTLPPIFLDEVSYQLFINCIKTDPSPTKRKFSVYYEIFRFEKLVASFHGSDIEFIKFIKRDFGVVLTRIEKELNMGNSVERNIFEKCKLQLFK